MSVVQLIKSQAFQPGCELWVIPRQNGGPLTKKMDWYLNFQISRAKAKTREELPPQLKMITNENNIPELAPSTKKSAPLMLSAKRGLPTNALVDLDDGTDIESWTQQLFSIWENLGKPKLRVFLPPAFSFESFRSLWPGPKTEEVQVVSG